MWSHILSEQLDLSPSSFWACVRDSELPDRGAPKPIILKKPVPLCLYRELTRLGVTDAEIAELSAGEAAELYARLLRDEQPEH